MPLTLNGFVSDRGNEPTEWQHAVLKPSVTMTWHHTIPWNTLSCVWNALVQGEHWQAAAKFLYLVGVTFPNPVIEKVKTSSLDDRDALHTRLTWQGWNIVEGPGEAFRNDDPGEAFDSWPGFGMTSNQRTTHQEVKSLYTVMQQVTAQPLVAGTQNRSVDAMMASRLEQSFDKAKQALRGKSYVPWTEAMWFAEREGRVNKNMSAVWDVQPVWRKRQAGDP